MVVLRPIALADLDPLFELAQQTAFGLTTLPKDRSLLERRIRDSLKSFEHGHGAPRGEAYLFVLEDLTTGRVAGTCGVVSKVGGFEPFYSYRVEKSAHESTMLGVRKEIPTLHLVQEHDGPSEIGSLFLLPEYRGGGNGRLISLARFLFIAEHPERFEPVVLAEMRGLVDDQGRSPFWDAVGRHFFDIDFPKADYLSMVNKRFIGELMPKFPIYIPLLPAEAQSVIGKVHKLTEPALAILESEGFRRNGEVDIFEAGPTVSCRTAEIRAVRESVRGKVAEVVAEVAAGSPTFIIARSSPEFRACKGEVEMVAGGFRIAERVSLGMKLRVGEECRVVRMKAGEGKMEGSEPRA